MKKIFLVGLLVLLAGCTDVAVPVENDDNPLEVSFTLTDTGQTFMYDENGSIIDSPDFDDPLYGQDGQFDGVQQSYTDNGDGTITDNVTGLMWQQTSDFERYGFDDAFDYVESLTLAGYDDWRLPTIKELLSIADFNGELMMTGESTPYINTDFFYFEYDSQMPFAGQFWSSTIYTGGEIANREALGLQGAFGFNFADGHIKSYETGYNYDGTVYTGMVPGCFVIAVRGEENVYGVNDFQENNDGTVTDLATGLMWTSDASLEGMDWVSALEYAKNAEVGGYDDWRLPNAKELQSIIDYASTAVPALDETFFTLVDLDCYVWTSTTHGDFKNTAIYLAIGKAYSIPSAFDEYYDAHGAGALRSDPKTEEVYEEGQSSINAEDLVRIFNYVLLVRDVD